MRNTVDLIPPLLEGLWVTIQVTTGGMVVAFAAAWIAGLARLYGPKYVRWVAVAYVEVFRGTSALVQLYWFYFALPFLGLELSAMQTGILVLGLNIGAYGAEVVRGAIQSVDKGQKEASVALNLSGMQTLWHVVVPQAAVAMMPPAGNLLVELMKATALVSLITLSDLTFQAQILRSETMRTTEVFLLLLAFYFVLALTITRTFRLIEKRIGTFRAPGAAT